jgi:hypothetical protein
MISMGRLCGAACGVFLVAVCSGRAATLAERQTAWRWVGHLASERLAGDGRGLLDETAFFARVRRLLADDGRATFEAYGPELPVAAAGRFLIVARCRSAGCDAGRATLVLDTGSEDVWYVTLEHGFGGAARCWRGTRALGDLPGAIQRGLLE